jgi:hypothetical protein
MSAAKEQSKKLLAEQSSEDELDTIVSSKVVEVEIDFLPGGYSR